MLPETCNYPLHLHGEYPQEYRPATLDGLVTCRYEGLADLRAALEETEVGRPLRDWLMARLGRAGARG